MRNNTAGYIHDLVNCVRTLVLTLTGLDVSLQSVYAANNERKARVWPVAWSVCSPVGCRSAVYRPRQARLLCAAGGGAGGVVGVDMR